MKELTPVDKLDAAKTVIDAYAKHDIVDVGERIMNDPTALPPLGPPALPGMPPRDIVDVGESDTRLELMNGRVRLAEDRRSLLLRLINGAGSPTVESADDTLPF